MANGVTYNTPSRVRTRQSWIAASFAAALALACTPAWSASPAWQGSAGQTWKVPAAWSTSQVPAVGDTVSIGGNVTVSMDYTYIPATAISSLLVDDAGGSAGQLAILSMAASSSLQIQNGLVIGGSGAGRLNQNAAATISADSLVLGDTATGAGMISLSAGTLTVSGDVTVGHLGTATVSITGGKLSIGGAEQIGGSGTGTITQTNGTHTLTGSAGLTLGGGIAAGSYNFYGGSLSVPHVEVESGGTFTQNGGALTATTFHLDGGTVAGSLINNGDFVYDGGTFTGRLYSDGHVTLNQDFTALGGLDNISTTPLVVAAGRSVNLQGTGLHDDGSLTLTGNLTTSNSIIGYLNNGAFSQNGGTHTVTSTSGDYIVSGLILGYTGGLTATYQLAAGNLQTPTETIGDANNVSATFTQTGGTHTITSGLYLGSWDASSAGSFALSSGSLTAGKVTVGDLGTGTFTQTGGTCTITGALTIASQPGSHGQYALQSGSLTAGSLANNDTFHQSGGTSQFGPITGPGSITVDASASLSATNLRQHALTAGGTVNIQADISASPLSVLDQLTVTGTVDLGNGDLIVHNGSLSNIRTLLQSGWATGAWNGTGISSATAGAHPVYGLLLLTGTDYLHIHPTGQFLDQTVVGSDIDVEYGLAGDLNLDGHITPRDMLLFDVDYLTGVVNPTSLSGDLNYDGVVDYRDAGLMQQAYLAQQTPAAQFVGNSSALNELSTIPEPASVGLLLAGAGMLFGRRRAAKPASRFRSPAP